MYRISNEISRSDQIASHTTHFQMHLTDIGEQVREARKARGWTQDQLAEASGVSRARITGLENGRLPEIGYKLLQRILLPLELDLRITDHNAGRPTLEQLQDENEREARIK